MFRAQVLELYKKYETGQLHQKMLGGGGGGRGVPLNLGVCTEETSFFLLDMIRFWRTGDKLI